MEKVKRKLTKMGNSVGVAIPQDVREHMNAKLGDEVNI